MPKIVDWDARRDEILSATWRVIARDGITGATIRAIAREASCSRGILAHYFDDKADILGSALVMSHRRVVARMTARADGLTGLAALRVVMLEALPLDEQRDLEAQIEISFWGRALGNPGLRKLQHAEFESIKKWVDVADRLGAGHVHDVSRTVFARQFRRVGHDSLARLSVQRSGQVKDAAADGVRRPARAEDRGTAPVPGHRQRVPGQAAAC